MKFYADTSFLFSYYASDPNSSRADAWRQAHPAPLLFSGLNRLELRNALELAVFQNRLIPKESADIWLVIESDSRAGFLLESACAWAEVLRDAELLATSQTARTGSRSLDILHIAAAQQLCADEFITFDRRQANLAKTLGLRIAGL